jgi:hypothetical protein
MAAEAGAQVVALDSDAAAIELSGGRVPSGQPITALVANIARPTPRWDGETESSCRCSNVSAGQFDLVLMLAVIHHLILREQIPLAHIGDSAPASRAGGCWSSGCRPPTPCFRSGCAAAIDLYGQLVRG